MFSIGRDLRATQVGVGEVGLIEVDGGVPPAIGTELRVTQVGVGEGGLSEVDDGVASLGLSMPAIKKGNRKLPFSIESLPF
jgi:hypothetical protein